MHGELIAGVGLPGAGKSSVLGALADLLIRQGVDATIYREPEESAWADAVHERERFGRITALTWFRSVRVPSLYRASDDRAQGKIAIVDSYYDKLIHLYLRAPEFAWLIPPDDPYRGIYELLAKKDYETLPDASCIVTFTVNPDRWKTLVLGRGRELDRKSDILTFHEMQPAFIAAANDYCAARGIPHVVFENTQNPVASAAEALSRALSDAGVLR